MNYNPPQFECKHVDEIVCPLAPLLSGENPLYAGLIDGQEIFITSNESCDEALVRTLIERDATDVRLFLNSHCVEPVQTTYEAGIESSYAIESLDNDGHPIEATFTDDAYPAGSHVAFARDQIQLGTVCAEGFAYRKFLSLKFSCEAKAVECRSYLATKGIPLGVMVVSPGECWLVIRFQFNQSPEELIDSEERQRLEVDTKPLREKLRTLESLIWQYQSGEIVVNDDEWRATRDESANVRSEIQRLTKEAATRRGSRLEALWDNEPSPSLDEAYRTEHGESRHMRPFVEIMFTKFGADVESSCSLAASIPVRLIGDATRIDCSNDSATWKLTVKESQLAEIVSTPVVDSVTSAQQEQALRYTLETNLSKLRKGENFETILANTNAAIGRIASANKPPITIRSAGSLKKNFRELRAPIIEGLIRQGETMNIIASPKTGKSWLAMGLALCVVAGSKWLGRFWTRKGKVLIVDNELHPETSSFRLPFIAKAMGIEPHQYDDRLFVANLRGQLVDMNELSKQLMSIPKGEYSLIILDAWYRFQPTGSDENSNADVSAIYNLLDSVASKIDCAFVCIHHTSKGNQGGRSVTDVGAGAGAQSRAPDAHLAIRQHEVEGAVVVDAAVRSFAPMQPFCLRWDFPCWQQAEDLDPKDIKQDRPSRKAKSVDESGLSKTDQKQQTDEERCSILVNAYRQYPLGETASEIRAVAKMNSDTFKQVNADLIRLGVIEQCKVLKSGRNWDGFKLKPSVDQSTSSDDFSGRVEWSTSQIHSTRPGSPPLGGAGWSSDCDGRPATVGEVVSRPVDSDVVDRLFPVQPA